MKSCQNTCPAELEKYCAAYEEGFYKKAFKRLLKQLKAFNISRKKNPRRPIELKSLLI
jgi:hypothetical protein